MAPLETAPATGNTITSSPEIAAALEREPVAATLAAPVVPTQLETAVFTGNAIAARRELDRDGAVGAEVRGTIEAMLSVRAEACD